MSLAATLCQQFSACSHTLAGHVLITGIMSFVVDNSETEFDERIDDVRQVMCVMCDV